MNVFQKIYPISYNKNKFQKVYDLLRAFFIYIIITILCVILILITDLIVTKIFRHSSIFQTHSDKEEYIKTIGIYKTALLSTIIAPVIEEISFRLFLKPNRLNVSLSIAFIVYMFSGPYCFFDDFENYIIRIIVSILIFMTSYSVYKSRWTANLYAIQIKLLVISSVCFGLVHIYNFSPIYWELIVLYPIYVLPQLFLGFIAGTIRIKNGFVWSLFLHILVNGSVTWPKLFW